MNYHHALKCVLLFAFLLDAGWSEDSCDYTSTPGELCLEIPEQIRPGTWVSLNGSNADPGDMIVLSLRCTMEITPQLNDYGDAPEPQYRTLLLNDGARHAVVEGVHLGAMVDGDFDGQPSLSGSCDDSDGTDDEDGVRFLTPLVAGDVAEIEVNASTTGYLNAWIDYDADKNWTGAGEQVLDDVMLMPGSNRLNFTVPATESPEVETYARFRFSTEDGLSFDGPARDGEVEDYLILLGPAGPTVPVPPEDVCPTSDEGPIWGARYCINSSDYNSMDIRPVGYTDVAWQHVLDWEDEMVDLFGMEGEHDVDKNPFYWRIEATDGRVVESKPYHGGLHPECWTLVVSGQSLNSSIKMTNTAKRIVQADELGNFSSTIFLPYTRKIGGTHTVLATGTNKVGTVNLSIDVSEIVNEPPIAFINAVDLFDQSWTVPVGQTFYMDGNTLSVDNDGYIVSYRWDLGDGTVVDGPQVSHAYDTSGDKLVTLQVTDDRGATDLMEAVIKVT